MLLNKVLFNKDNIISDLYYTAYVFYSFNKSRMAATLILFFNTLFVSNYRMVPMHYYVVI